LSSKAYDILNAMIDPNDVISTDLELEY